MRVASLSMLHIRGNLYCKVIFFLCEMQVYRRFFERNQLKA